MTPQAHTVMSEQQGFQAPTASASAASIALILATQASLGVGFSLVAALMASPAAGYSALIGTLVCLVPSALFGAIIMATMFAGLGAKLQLHSFYAGEVFKLAVTVVLFIVVFTAVPGLQPLYLFGGFMVTQLAMLAVLLRG